MPDAPPSIATSSDGVARCKDAMIAAIDRAKTEPAAIDTFWNGFEAVFARNLTPDKIAARWADHGRQLLYLSTVIGQLAQFKALSDPRDPRTVGESQLKWALAIVQNECRLKIDDGKTEKLGLGTPPNKHPLTSYCDIPGGGG